MKTSFTYLLPLLALLSTGIQAGPLRERSTSSFAGSNNYFLHALSADEQSNYIITGATGACEKGSQTTKIPDLETTIGTYDDTVLDALDSVLAQLTEAGIKAIISPHDAGVVAGTNGCDVYCDKYTSSDNFYGSDSAKSEYDARLAHILNYVSPSSGKKWGQWPDAIAAFDIENEPMIGSVGKLQDNDPDDWICGRAGNMQSVIGGSGVRIATGGIGGSDYCCDHEFNLLDKALACDAIDIMSVHGYMTAADQWQYFIPSLEQQAAAKGKLLMIEEWGVTGDPSGQFADQVAVFNDAGVPWLYWQVVPGADQTQSCSGSCCGNNNGNSYDGFEIGLDSSKGDVAGAVSTANGQSAPQDWGFIVS
ncbi:MAG: hypothetical protein M4579_005011 [Chaenotheca gracillima]|nr:MAG: hypothetical protein M4579_005011 [Chaenotheca gracillima]